MQAQSLPVSRVLVIEKEPLLRRVIVLGLCQSGLKVSEASSLEDLRPVDVEAQPPDLLIIDVDQGIQSNWSLVPTLRQWPALSNLPLVVLSWELPVETQHVHTTSFLSLFPFLSSRTIASTVSANLSPDSNVIHLPKPFDARALSRVISTLLAERVVRQTTKIALAEEECLVAYQQYAVPSIWPVVTAAGLLLITISLLLHIFLTIAGIALVFTALLFWLSSTIPTSSCSARTVATLSPVPVPQS
jgi:CheY-like chemotaxis protein